MPRDTVTDLTEAAPDLTIPSLAGLAWALRHRETWPQSYHWSFSSASTCAMGLVTKLWPDSDVFSIRDQFHAPLDLGHLFSLSAYAPVSNADVTPEMVAARIETVLARSAEAF